MKKLLAITLLILCFASCSQQETNLTITGEISGLKKGTIYLQKFEDTSLVNIDSVIVRGEPNFTFETFIEEPQILYLYLDKIDNNVQEDRIDFFAEPGEMKIITSLKNFGQKVIVEGSENQEKLEEYRTIAKRFNNDNLDLIKESFEADRSGNDSLLIQAINKQNNLTRRKYLYTINFAVNNKDKEVAPYLMLSHAYDANTKYLDTVYKSLTPQIQNSLYGKELKSFLEERRELEKGQDVNS